MVLRGAHIAIKVAARLKGNVECSTARCFFGLALQKGFHLRLSHKGNVAKVAAPVCWSRAAIEDVQSYASKPSIAAKKWFFDAGPNISAQLTISRVASNLVGLSRKAQGPNDEYRSDETENGSEPSRRYLFFGGLGSPYLGIQIAGIVLAAFSLSALTGVSLFRAFDNGDSKGIWLPIAVASSFAGLFFWGWAWAGNPLSAWGLAP